MHQGQKKGESGRMGEGEEEERGAGGMRRPVWGRTVRIMRAE